MVFTTNLDVRRHMELFDPHSFNTKINVIGAGATGSWLAFMLAKLGIRGDLINVWDFDTVEEHNIPNQLYGMPYIGDKKVQALGTKIFSDLCQNIVEHDKKFTSGRLSGYVFMMIDTMEGRKSIWEKSIKGKRAVELLVEPRMGLDLGRIYNVNPLDITHQEKYESTLYSDEEAEVSACGTSQSVITTAMGVASWCVRQLIEHHAGNELDNEILIDFKYNNLITERWS